MFAPHTSKLNLASLAAILLISPAAPADIWAWGSNQSGQLGNSINLGNVSPNPTGLPANGVASVIAITAGAQHSLALKADGSVWAWGSNWYGQLGSSVDFFHPNPKPGQVAEVTGAIAIAAGRQHSLAVTRDETVWAWGLNLNGQLGRGAPCDSRPNPTPAPVTGLSGVVAAAAGEVESLALKSDGTVFAWGSSDCQSNPGAVSAPHQVTALRDIIAIAAGKLHFLALRKDGTVWAWGYDADGQAGGNSSATPQPVSALTGIAAIAAGDAHSLAVKNDGTVWAWGSNALGQLGSNTNVGRLGPNPRPTPVNGLSGVVRVAAGQAFSIASKTDGSLWAWGYNRYGQLGNPMNAGALTANALPLPVIGVSNAISIAAGSDHSLALADSPRPQPAINPGGIVDAASFRPGLSPGAIVSIFGTNLSGDVAAASAAPLPPTLLDTTVAFNGIAAPLFFVSPTQINAQVPFETATGTVNVEVRRGSAGMASQSIRIDAASPAIFSAGSLGLPAVVHAENSTFVNSASPAVQGDFISIFCTGLGFVAGVASGEPSPARETAIRPDVRIAGTSAAVTYAGLAPGFVGLYQINAQVPSDAPPGTAQPLAISSGKSVSNMVPIAIVARPPNVTPSILDVSSSRTGDGGLLLRVSGYGLNGSSIIRVDNHDQPTTYDRVSLRLNTAISLQNIVIGKHLISVYNPAPGGGVSNSIEVDFVYDLSGLWRGSWRNTAGIGGSLEVSLRETDLSRFESRSAGTLWVAGSNIVSQCNVVARTGISSVAMDATCLGYLDLHYQIHYDGSVGDGSAVEGTWSVSTQGATLDSGSFQASRSLR